MSTAQKIDKKTKMVLVLMLNSGENEYQSSLKSLDRQTYKHIDRVVFSDLSNKEAHDTLYSYIMDNSHKYDLFVKLDADMVLINNMVLENIVQFFEPNPNVDQANFSVHDVMSDWNIMGLLAFTGRARWEINDEKLFVDHTPKIPGKRLLIWGKPSPVALHCPDPHLFEAFHYGAHRALKAIQKGRQSKKWIQSAIQWHLLARVWRNYVKFKDKKRGMMMAGAFSVWSGEVDLEANEYSNKSLKDVFRKYTRLKNNQMHALFKRKWEKVIRFNDFLYILLWPKIVEYKIRCRISVIMNNFCQVPLSLHTLSTSVKLLDL